MDKSKANKRTKRFFKEDEDNSIILDETEQEQLIEELSQENQTLNSRYINLLIILIAACCLSYAYILITTPQFKWEACLSVISLFMTFLVLLKTKEFSIVKAKYGRRNVLIVSLVVAIVPYITSSMDVYWLLPSTLISLSLMSTIIMESSQIEVLELENYKYKLKGA
jgi:hypothetical protein